MSSEQEEKRPWQPWMRPRWARASAEPAHLCRDDSHSAEDYTFWERHVTSGKLVLKIGCDVCWPRATNPTAVKP